MADALSELLERGRGEELYTHASLAVVRRGILEIRVGTGIFDVASLTKVFTATLANALLPLDQAVPWLDSKARVSELLAHRSGLPAWRPFFAHAAKEAVVSLAHLNGSESLHERARAITKTLLAQTPPSAPKPTYSDLNFLALGFELERVTGTSLAKLADEKLFRPLRLTSTQWGGLNANAVPTGRGRPRAGNPEVEGDVVAQVEGDPALLDFAPDDDNAAAMGGATGHAGIFSTSIEMALLGDRLRDASAGARYPFITPAQASKLFEKATAGRTYGLDTPTGEAPAIGTILGRGPLGAAGHLGFTGCSLWIDRDAGLSIAFLTNAVAIARPSLKIREFRRLVHDAVAREFRLGT